MLNSLKLAVNPDLWPSTTTEKSLREQKGTWFTTETFELCEIVKKSLKINSLNSFYSFFLLFPAVFLCLCFSLQDPTNGYYNVRASTHDEVRPASHSTMHYSDYRSPTGTPGGAASISSSTGGSGATASGGAPGPPGPLTSPGRPQACYDPRPPSRLSHISYAQFNTFTRGGQSQQPPANPAPATSDFPGDCSLLDSTSQLAYDNYGYPSHYQTYRMGFAPSSLAPLEAGPSYEMYGVGSGVGSPGVGVGPGGPAPSGSETGLGKYGSSTRFSYTSQHSDYSHSRHTQRMQTHVWDRDAYPPHSLSCAWGSIL